MKKFAWILVAMLIASTAFSAEVLSKNAVGFVKIEMEAGQLQALTIPFDDNEYPEGIPWPETSIAKEAEDTSAFYYWDGEGWKGGTLTKNATRTNWAKAAREKKLLPGEMFFFQSATKRTYTISGEVPATNSMNVAVRAGGLYSAVGNPYPVKVLFPESELAQAAENADAVYFWNGSSWEGTTLTKNETRTNWGKVARTNYLEPGKGIFFQAAGDAQPREVVFDRPYKWPNEDE